MNRYSLIFALLVASSFAVHPTQVGDGTPVGGSEKAPAARQSRNPGTTSGAAQSGGNGSEGQLSQDAVKLIGEFISRARKPSEAKKSLQILFATVPHPVETHLAAAFDHNVDALQDGLQEAGYLFDSSWIPWSVPRERDDFNDDLREKMATEEEDGTPGILLFRRNLRLDAGAPGAGPAPDDPYAYGILVFLISEKPTEGIALPQVMKAVEILQESQIGDWVKAGKPQSPGSIRILGPTYSGSLASLGPMVKSLCGNNPTCEVLIRSGDVTGGEEAVRALGSLGSALPGVRIDFGSAHHDYSDWSQAAESTLFRMGIPTEQMAFLSEAESSFGGYTQEILGKYKKASGGGNHGEWTVYFPRDISSLRAGYEKQGLFDAPTSAPTWKRFLNLKSDEQSEGDSIRSFGGATTTGTKEAILFGISEFLKSHAIRAAIISATNEEDRLFLTQFLHANNPGVRVVVIGTTRVFMRGTTAQFRGDLMVSDFPMLPRLHDWTGLRDDATTRIFADDAAQGTFFAVIDLFGTPRESDHRYKFGWYPEYSEPDWANKGNSLLLPPMYVVALGGNATWPVSETKGHPWGPGTSGGSSVEFPFAHFGHDWRTAPEQVPNSPDLHVGRYLKILALSVSGLILLYCAGIWYANPVSRDHFASFQPSQAWEFWLLKVTVPAAAAGGAFWVLAWAAAIPRIASSDAVWWWTAAEAATLLAPASIVGSALGKAVWTKVPIRWKGWPGISVLLSLLSGLTLSITGFFVAGPFAGGDVSSILNTYREMHWESGLSLVPSLLLFLAAILVWASQAGNGAAALKAAPPLPSFPGNLRISQEQADLICGAGRPLPNMRTVKWLWITWAVPAVALLIAHFFFGPFKEITTLESSATTFLVRGAAGIVALVILFDLLQFLWLWDGLRVLLRALDRAPFKRSFVTIRDFDWRGLWSFTGVSFQSRRAINAALIDCLLQISRVNGFTGLRGEAAKLKAIRDYYNSCDLDAVSRKEYLDDKDVLFEVLSRMANRLAIYIEDPQNAGVPVKISDDTEALQRVLERQHKGDGGRFSDEEEELARLPQAQQAVERFLCLMYIGFIQTVVARLHTLLISVASMFSMLALGVAIYPFVPVASLLVAGGALLVLIAWAFFKVFSQMDTDPILSRIVNGDDRKLQGNFYMKFAEAMALPLLTAGSSLLPGGAGRLLELVQALFPHGQ